MQEIVRKGLKLVSGLDEPLPDARRMTVHAKAQYYRERINAERFGSTPGFFSSTGLKKP